MHVIAGKAVAFHEALQPAFKAYQAQVVANAKVLAETLIARGIDGDKIDVVTNGVDIGRFSPRPKDAALEHQLGFSGCFVAGYVGTHGMAHALETLLEAARILAATPGGESVRLMLLGDGARKAALKEQAVAMGLHNVVFVDTVPKDEVARYWSLLDVAVIHLRRSDLFTTVIPSKLFECMGMGIPVLHGVEGESAGIVRREDVGIAFEPENAQALADALLLMKIDLALRRRFAARAPVAALSYDRRALAARMLTILRRAAGRSADGVTATLT